MRTTVGWAGQRKAVNVADTPKYFDKEMQLYGLISETLDEAKERIAKRRGKNGNGDGKRNGKSALEQADLPDGNGRDPSPERW